LDYRISQSVDLPNGLPSGGGRRKRGGKGSGLNK
jgi:hypothetical protein